MASVSSILSVPNPVELAEARPSWWKWAIVVTASLGAILEVIDTSIVNVALTEMQGNLGATLSEIGWVVTGYAVANVVIIPLSAWLGEYFGKKNYFIFCLIGFTLASILCGLSTSLPMLIVSRVIQGLTGGGLLAKAQAIIYDTFPKEEQGLAQAVFGMGVIAGPAIGPTLGGYLTDAMGWRSIFFINIPFGIMAVIAASIFFYPDKKRDPAKKMKVDWLGIGFLVLGLASFQVMLEEGYQEDWFASPFIVLMAVLAAVGLVLFIWQELTVDEPAVDIRVFRYPSLWSGSLSSMVLGMVLYGATFAIPIFAQNILHYNALKTGFLLLPSAIASGSFMIITGILSKKFDARFIIVVGASLLAISIMQLAQINLNTSEDSLFWPNVLRGIGTVMMYLPLTMASLGPIPGPDIASASGLLNLTRQVGGSIGVAILTTTLSARENFHRSILVDHVSQYDPMVRQQIAGYAGGFQAHGSSATVAKQQAMMAINGSVDLQAAVLSFADIFWMTAMVLLASLLLLFFLGSGKEKGGGIPMDAH